MADTAETARLRAVGGELQEMCMESIGRANRAQKVENIVKYRAMADAYGSAADLLWRRAGEIEAAS